MTLIPMAAAAINNRALKSGTNTIDAKNIPTRFKKHQYACKTAI